MNTRPRRPMTAPVLTAVSCAVASWTCLGCSTAARTIQPVDRSGLSSVAYAHSVANAPVATVGSAARLLADLSAHTEDGNDGSKRSEAAAYDALVARGSIRAAWNVSPNAILDAGTLAYMLRAEGGLTPSTNERLASFTGLGDRRYALRSCIADGLLPPQREDAPVSGGALLEAVAALANRMD